MNGKDTKQIMNSIKQLSEMLEQLSPLLEEICEQPVFKGPRRRPSVIRDVQYIAQNLSVEMLQVMRTSTEAFKVVLMGPKDAKDIQIFQKAKDKAMREHAAREAEQDRRKYEQERAAVRFNLRIITERNRKAKEEAWIREEQERLERIEIRKQSKKAQVKKFKVGKKTRLVLIGGALRKQINDNFETVDVKIVNKKIPAMAWIKGNNKQWKRKDWKDNAMTRKIMQKRKLAKTRTLERKKKHWNKQTQN
jgi:hypothetical protein